MLPAHIPDNNSSFVLRDQTFQRFSLAEIELATNNFDEALVIGRGGYGKVYKSVTELGSIREVAIKRLHSASTQGATEFEAEVKVLHKLRHANLVSLIGYCSEGKEMVLAYEFMPNGNLEDHIHESATELSWLQRLKICIGAARGLDYLHTGMSTQHGVIHRDVKTSNILLDKNFAAKISDFGLAKVGPVNQTRSFVKTRVKGTFGYLDPSYFYSGKLTRKSDVYAFGVVLLEVLSGKKAVDESLDEEQQSLVVWAQDHIKKGNLDDIIDHSLIEQATKKCLKEFASIAVKCLLYEPKQRLTMSEVVVKLESILSQERKNADPSIDEGRLIDKVRYFFTTKTELILDSEVGSSEVGAYNSKRGSAELASKILGPDIRKYTYPELVSATNNFGHRESSRTSQEIIYKGWVDEHTYAPSECAVGLAMYVRRRHIGTSTLELQHGGFVYPNLVKLLGYCLNEQELYCVYELIPDASLDKLLFVDPGTTSLSWAARLKIALGAAQGLSFLHQRNHPAYNQFKAANILVDSDYNARLSDYELGKPYEGFSSYSHYTDPFSNGRRDRFSFQLAKFEGHRAALPSRRDGLILKSEIYNFGVVLLEILTGMKEFDESRVEGKQSLTKWATPLLADEENLGIIIDPLLQHNDNPPKGAFKFALLVSNCLQPTKEERPSMEEVFQILYPIPSESS